MKVRAVTVGGNIGLPFDGAAFAKLADFGRHARERIEQRGVEVQTPRVGKQHAGDLGQRHLRHQPCGEPAIGAVEDRQENGNDPVDPAGGNRIGGTGQDA